MDVSNMYTARGHLIHLNGCIEYRATARVLKKYHVGWAKQSVPTSTS